MATTVVDVVMPQMGVSVSEGTILKWLKQEGETIEADEPLLEISTDKVDTEVPSPAPASCSRFSSPRARRSTVGTRLAVIAPEGAEIEEEPAEPEPEPVAGASPLPRRAGSRLLRCTGARTCERREDVRLARRGAHCRRARHRRIPGARHRSRWPRDEEGHPRVRRVRAARRAAARGSAARGTAGRAAPAEAPPAAPPAAPEPAPAAEAPAPAPAAAGETVEPMNAMRRGVAEHMRRSLDTSAHVTSAIEVDMSAVVAIRGKLKPEYEKGYGVNPTYLAFVARAAVDTLRDYPWINGEMRGESIVARNYVNLGIAVELADGKGLIVPVIRNAEGLNLLGVTRAIADLAERSRSKKLLPDDVQGGTFTITNPGGYGTFHGTPIINQPQAAILGTYAVVKRPWVIQDARGADVIAVRPIMNVTLTYDHRLVDGALAGRFLRDLREKLETWPEEKY